MNGYPTCGTGFSLHDAWVHIYASTITLTDNQPPTGVAASGPVTSGGWQRGAVAGAISGADNLGIERVRWYADGEGVATSEPRACDFSTTVPCSDASGVPYAFDTTRVADGTRSVRAAVVDPAGNETRGAAFDVRVDNTAPAAPRNLVVTGGGAEPTFGMSWTNPEADGGSPYVSSRWQACAGESCTSGAGGLTSAAGTLPPGSATVRVWLVDEAGNQTISNAATASITYGAPAGGGGGGGGQARPAAGAPGAPAAPDALSPVAPIAAPVPPAPTAGWPAPGTPTPARSSAGLKVTTAKRSSRTGRLLVRGTIDRRATGRITITYRAKVGRSWTSRRATARLTRGRFTASLALTKPLRTARRATVTIAYPGSATVRPVTRTIAL